MQHHDPDRINRLIGEFTELQERWENHPENMDWSTLQALAVRGADAYNEGAGPSFHALALDGVDHGEFHERFLVYSVQAGLDPFKLVHPGTGTATIPVIDHASLADAAQSNPTSARMHAYLMELAQARFAPLIDELQADMPASSRPWYSTLNACAESIPLDLLKRLAPELAKTHHGEKRKYGVNPVESYLTDAEAIVDTRSQPYG